MPAPSDGLAIDECVAVLRPMGSRTWAELSNAEGRALFGEIRLVALRRFRSDVITQLPMAYRLRARAVLADRIDLVRRLAAIELGMRTDLGPAAVAWSDGKLLLSVSASIMNSDGTPPDVFRANGRLSWRPMGLANETGVFLRDLDVTEEFSASRIEIVLRHRTNSVEFVLPLRTEIGEVSGSDRPELSFAGTGELDPGVAADGTALGRGIWDLNIRMVSCGWESMRRLRYVEQIPNVAPAPVAKADLVAVPYVTERGNLSLRVRSLQPEAARSQSGLARTHGRRRGHSGVSRRLRRMVPSPIRRIAKRALRPFHYPPVDESGV